jgi:hypothetical protein
MLLGWEVMQMDISVDTVKNRGYQKHKPEKSTGHGFTHEELGTKFTFSLCTG